MHSYIPTYVSKKLTCGRWHTYLLALAIICLQKLTYNSLVLFAFHQSHNPRYVFVYVHFESQVIVRRRVLWVGDQVC